MARLFKFASDWALKPASRRLADRYGVGSFRKGGWRFDLKPRRSHYDIPTGKSFKGPHGHQLITDFNTSPDGYIHLKKGEGAVRSINWKDLNSFINSMR